MGGFEGWCSIQNPHLLRVLVLGLYFRGENLGFSDKKDSKRLFFSNFSKACCLEFFHKKIHEATFLRPIFLFPSNPSNKKNKNPKDVISESDILGFIGNWIMQKISKKNKKNPKVGDAAPRPPISSSHLVLRLGLCRHFGIHPTQMAFAYDPDGASVCRERLLPWFAFRFFQQPGCFF